MNLIYKKLFDIDILHDYYLKGIDEANNSIWPNQYTILNDLEFVPTQECSKILNQFQLITRQKPYGLSIYCRALKSKLSENDFSSFIYIPNNLKLTFLLQIKSAYFSNYTNLRITGNGKYLYHFGNHRGHISNSQLYLSSSMPEYSEVPPGESKYQWGDMVLHSGKKYDSIKITDASSRFNARNWMLIDIADASYLTIKDRTPWQSPVLTFESVNTNPGETIKFVLTDTNNNPVDLGNIPNTDQPQDTFIAPAKADEKVFYRINLNHIPMGRYKLKITRSASESNMEFYLIDPLKYPSSFGVIEMFSNVSDSNMDFLEYIESEGSKESLIRFKQYTIRFRNRYTHWKFIASDGSETLLETPYPLNKITSGYKHNGNETIWPTPEVNYIDPIRNKDEPELIEDIISEIYLNKQYKNI